MLCVLTHSGEHESAVSTAAASAEYLQWLCILTLVNRRIACAGLQQRENKQLHPSDGGRIGASAASRRSRAPSHTHTHARREQINARQLSVAVLRPSVAMLPPTVGQK